MHNKENASSDIFAPPQAELTVHSATEYDTSSILSTKGRFGRIDYIAHSIALIFLGSVLNSIFMGLMAALQSPILVMLASILFTVPIAIISVIFMIRRLHDMDWSGWLTLLMFVPVVNLIFYLLLSFMPGIPGANSYGPPRKPPSKVSIFVAIVLPVIVAIGMITLFGALAARIMKY